MYREKVISIRHRASCCFIRYMKPASPGHYILILPDFEHTSFLPHDNRDGAVFRNSETYPFHT